MVYFQLFLFSTILIFIELLFLPLPFFLVAMLLWSIYVAEDYALITAFIGGILYDILLLRPIGYTSFLLLMLLFVAIVYKRKFQSTNFLFLVFWSFVSSIIFVYFNIHAVMWGVGILCAGITLFLARLFFFQFQRTHDVTLWIK